MEGRHLTRRSGFVLTLALAGLLLGIGPGIAIADGVSTSTTETLGQATGVDAGSTSALSQTVSGTTQSATGVAEEASGDTTQAVSDTTKAATNTTTQAVNDTTQAATNTSTQAVSDTTQAASDTTQAATNTTTQAVSDTTQAATNTTTQAVSDTTQAATNTTTQAGTNVASGAGSNLNAAGTLVDKNASSTVSMVNPTGSTTSSAQDGGATATEPGSTTASGDPVASSADPRHVRSRDPIWVGWASPYQATATSSSVSACPRLGATCIGGASANPGGSLGDAVVLAIRWLATTGLDILFRLVLACGLALAGAFALEAARRQQAPQLR